MKYCLFFLLVLWSCTQPIEHDSDKLFHRLLPGNTGIHFVNEHKEQQDFDVFRYRNYYNGGGVGIGDFNNDGLSDIFFTSNMGDNKLYLNKGDWKFEDITEKSGVKGTRIWSTGVSIADVNADGLLDIYVSNAGDVKGGNRENELFINNGDLTFTDRAEEYGLADKGYSTHAVFFDYDKDGDLDCYVLNNSPRSIASLGYRNLRNVRDEMGGHKLYQNNKGKFTDVSIEAGIFGSVIGFGLGVTVGDVNQDSWPDMYISNDFYEMDYLYINNKNGGFDEKVQEHMDHISMFSMGADLADLNNDGYPEIFSTDMLPEDYYRLKTLVAFETYDVYMLRLKNGYYHQFMRNMLQLNNGDGTYSEIGQLAGVDATDWSWGALIADFNNDRNKEIFVCNGVYKDLINQDFVEFLGSNEQLRAVMDGKKVDYKEIVSTIPSQKVSNYLFEAQGYLNYKNVSKDWGLAEPSFSNGAAYGDLDNDGDLDLVVSNVNQEPFVYKNNSQELARNNFISFSFKGTGNNTFALGTSIRVYVGNEIVSYDHMPIRGFQSSMDYKMIIGLGKIDKIDSIEITWPDLTRETLYDATLNQTTTLSNANGKAWKIEQKKNDKPLLEAVESTPISHKENFFNELDVNRLQYHMLSTQGPGVAVSDLNNDGLDDLFVGGSVGSLSKIFMQQAGFIFKEIEPNPFVLDLAAEDVNAVFFDGDGDGDDDLYIVTGGTEVPLQSSHSADRYYENKGLKNGVPMFEKKVQALPALYFTGSCARAADFDDDGDLDIFVGTRVTPQYYGMPCDQVLLVNDGKGNFTDATDTLAPQFKKLGMVTDATWVDYNADDKLDLIVVGEWMKITFFRNENGNLKLDETTGLDKSSGWWNTIKPADIDGDGDLDFVLGNLGKNTKFKASPSSPVLAYINDFDKNGSVEPVYALYNNGKEYPLALRQELVKQMSVLKKKLLFYKDFATKSLTDIFDQKLLDEAVRLEFDEPHTSLLINNGKNGFELKKLPVEAQFSPVYAIECFDVNKDGNNDIILGGNLFAAKPEVGRYDAMHGLVLLNDGKGEFNALSSSKSGLNIKGEIRHIRELKSKNQDVLAFIRNNDSVVFYNPVK